MASNSNIPVNLGKPSLRLRLEAYYSLISPEVLTSQDEWRAKFELIYQKYGGSVQGERKLGAKLSKKYGNTVRLLMADPIEFNISPPIDRHQVIHDETQYDLSHEQRDSGVVKFTSSSFDPMAVLATKKQIVSSQNTWLATQKSPLLNHIDQFRSYLPICDPQRRTGRTAPPPKISKETPSDTKPKLPSVFAAIAANHENGPPSLLYQIMLNRLRVRVIIRYVNGIRGTLTGYLLAFDKHMNMILRDVAEVYCPRPLPDESSEYCASNVEIELNRRTSGLNPANHISGEDQKWSVRQRYMKQILVRGDNVVLVYKAEQERSNWPPSSKSPVTSVYGIPTVHPTSDRRVGTPGSLIHCLQRQERRRSSPTKR